MESEEQNNSIRRRVEDNSDISLNSANMSRGVSNQKMILSKNISSDPNNINASNNDPNRVANSLERNIINNQTHSDASVVGAGTMLNHARINT
jgi:hypothetical protein